MSFESRLKGFSLEYHSTHSDDHLWYLILRAKQKKKKKRSYTRINGRNNNYILEFFLGNPPLAWLKYLITSISLVRVVHADVYWFIVA